MILYLPNTFKQRRVTLQLTEVDPAKLSEKATGVVINGLLQDKHSLIGRIDYLTSQLKKVEASNYQPLSAAIDISTPYYGDYSVKDGVIVHTKEEVWSSIYLRQELPSKGKFQLNLELIKFRDKSLMLGIGVGSLRKIQSSHSYQGSVMICFSEGQTSVYEKCGRSKASRGIAFEEGDCITMKIDIDNLILSWWLGDIQIVWTRIQKEHVEKQLYVKCEMFGVND